MMNPKHASIFFTGFPGFIAKQLVDRIATQTPEARFTFLVQAHLQAIAQQAIRDLDQKHPGIQERSNLVVGDITEVYLGIPEDDYRTIASDTAQVWHLAAIYDLAVEEEVAYQVNVTGTEKVLDFCEACTNLKRFHYVSTCYVSGSRTDRVLESELNEGQTFKNHYESTKFWAEVEVRRRMESIPTTIYRPGIVVGDSKTGYTDKYDGPYYIIQLLLRLPSWLPTVNLGKSDARVNIVPVDFLVDAMASLSTEEAAIGETIQLADPAPHVARDIVAEILRILGRRKPVANVPSAWVEKLMNVDVFRQTLRIPKQAVVYFHHSVEYDTANQQRLLANTGIHCPDLFTILPTLVEYVREHPDKPFLDGRD